MNILSIRPGDTLVVTTDRVLTREHRETIESHICEKTGVSRVAILDGGLNVTVLRAVA